LFQSLLRPQMMVKKLTVVPNQVQMKIIRKVPKKKLILLAKVS
jgi:hypothetical protein